MINDGARTIQRGAAAPVLWGRVTRSSALLLASVLLLACAGQSAPSTGAPVPAVRIESGVIALTPPASGLSDSAGDVAGEEDGASGQGAEPTTRLTPLDQFDVGAEVQARGLLRIYAAAEPTAPTLAEYAQGARFTVLGPPGDVVTYPVELSGVRWYRVRAADDLVGWVIADGIELAPAME